MICIWSLITLFLFIIELMTFKIKHIWYSLSSLFTIYIAANNDSFLLQFITFVLLGYVLLFLFKNKTIEYLKNKKAMIDSKKLLVNMLLTEEK